MLSDYACARPDTFLPVGFSWIFITNLIYARRSSKVAWYFVMRLFCKIGFVTITISKHLCSSTSLDQFHPFHKPNAAPRTTPNIEVNSQARLKKNSSWFTPMPILLRKALTSRTDACVVSASTSTTRTSAAWPVLCRPLPVQPPYATLGTRTWSRLRQRAPRLTKPPASPS